MTELRMRFASALRQERASRNLSQEQLAELAGLHRTYVSEVERGLRNVSIDNIGKLAEALGLRVSQLFDVAEQMSAA